MKTLRLAVALGAFALTLSLDAKVVRDIPYYEGEELAAATPYQVERCKLDISYPEGMTNFPTLVWFHGGGLTGGRKNFIPLRSDKIAQVAVNYRLLGVSNVVDGAVCIGDAAAAIAWTLRHVAEYGGSSNKVFVAGSSAGGYLTMMTGMDPRWLGKYGFKPTDLAGIAPNSGQATKHFNVRKFAGDTRPQFVPVIDELAPLNYCSADLPPIVCIAGEPPWEWKCRSEENELLIASCVALGHKKAWYVRLPYANHGRTMWGGVPYIEMFVNGNYPAPLAQ